MENARGAGADSVFCARYAVHLNLADQQLVNDNEQEAYKIYTQIVKNKQSGNWASA